MFGSQRYTPRLKSPTLVLYAGERTLAVIVFFRRISEVTLFSVITLVTQRTK